MIANYKQAVPLGEPEPEFDENTLLLLHGEELVDASMYAHAIQNQSVTISSAQSKFGGSSMYFNGNSRLLISDVIDFGNSDFTIDWWEYCTASTGNARFSNAYFDSSGYSGLLLGYNGTGVYASSSYHSWSILSGTSMLDVSMSQWIHWAVVRKGGTLTSYKNGNQYAAANFTGSVYCYENDSMVIGDFNTIDKRPFSGYIDEFRISKVARWTENFIPPTEPYTG